MADLAALQADPELEQPEAPQADPAALARIGKTLSAKFLQYEIDRRLAELKWARNARQYLGIYDPDIELKMDRNKSKAYPKLTRVKCVSMLSRLMNLLFQVGEKNWAISASAVPNLPADILQPLLDKVAQQATQAQQTPTGAMAEQAIREEARTRAVRLELEVEDQLQDLGGSRAQDYVALCRQVLASGIQYGMGVMKGPFVETQKQRTFSFDQQTGRFVVGEQEAYRPRYEFVPVWDYYPDMSAKHLHQMDGQFQRHVMSKHQVTMLRERPDFKKSQIDEFLRTSPTGNYRRRAFETELKAMGVQINVTEAERGKYEALSWEGNVSGKDLAAAGVDVPVEKMNSDVRANIWLLGEVVIKATLDPWAELNTDGEMPMYHHFIFEEDESTLLGNGLPNIMRDSQMNVCAATRMMIDNGSIARVFELNTALLSMNQDTTTIHPDMIFYREDESPSTMQIPALRTIQLDQNLPAYRELVQMFQGFADQETFVGPATGGDTQKGPSEPFRTASGASMLRGDAALPFKDVVRNFDAFTQSVIGSIIVFNRNFNSNPDVKGDFQAVARGATSLIAKEVLGLQLDNLATTLTDEEKQYIDMRKLARNRVRVRDLDANDLVYDDAKCDQIDAQAGQKAKEQEQLMQEMTTAQIRQVLADTLKAISQAGKNSAAAEATTANLILSALEKGLTINDVTHAGDGAGAGGAGAAGADGAAYGGAAPDIGMPPDQAQGAPADMFGGGVPGPAGGGGGGGFAPPPVQ